MGLEPIMEEKREDLLTPGAEQGTTKGQKQLDSRFRLTYRPKRKFWNLRFKAKELIPIIKMIQT